MKVEKQVEYDIKNYIGKLVDGKIDEEINKLLNEDLKEFSSYELLIYSLIAIENEFKLDTLRVGSMHQNAAGLKVLLEWFIKVILRKGNINKNNFSYDKEKYEKLQSSIGEIRYIYENCMFNNKFQQMRGIDKINIEINDKGEYFFKEAVIEEQDDSSDIYFYGGYTDSEEFEKERKIKSEAINKIFEVYICGKSKISIEDFFSLNKIDDYIYSLCKDNIRVDIDKIGCGFNSDIFKNKDTIIDVLAAFIYMSHVITIRNDFKSLSPGIVLFEEPVIISKDNMIKLLKKFSNIADEELSKIIDYFTLSGESRLGINEYPLINIQDCILWIPSSFIANDFQFSIVNGHYGKNIKIINHKETVAQSVVDKIVNECRKCNNIVISSDKPYADENEQFNNKTLRGEIDVALYDTISNSVLIIECKWEDKLFVRGNQYKIICDEVNKIYNKQLKKDEYFLNLNINNLDFIFNNDVSVKNRLYYPNNIQYIMVDKRIQLHYEGKHALSEYTLLKILKDNTVNGILKLDNVISYIKSLETKVEYKVGDVISQISYKDKIINNTLFSILK